jgi:hypothetical protein
MLTNVLNKVNDPTAETEEPLSPTNQDERFIELNRLAFAPLRCARRLGTQETSRYIHEWISRVHSGNASAETGERRLDA